MEIQDWLITNVPVSVKGKIKQRAMDYGGTIPQILGMLIDEDMIETSKGGNSWLIHNIPEEVRKDIQRAARDNRMSVGAFFRQLMKSWKAREKYEKIRQEIKREILEEVNGVLNNP